MAEKVNQTPWGYELVWANTEDYCGKILVFNKVGDKTSMFFYKNKTRSWFVNQGKFLLKCIDIKTGVLYQEELIEGQTWHCLPLIPYQLECLSEGANITEVGTTDEEALYITPEAQA